MKTKFKETEIGMIPEDWEIIKMGDVCSKIGSGVTPRGGEKVYKNFGIALIRSQNVHNNSFSNDGLVYVDETIAKEMENVVLEKDDTLLNITGDSVARCCTIPEKILPARVNQHVSIIRTNREQLNPIFLRYYLTSPIMQAYMLSLAQSGGTRNALTKGMIEKFIIPKPPQEEQITITKILSDLDSKIELNQQMNKTLEEICKAIFKHWFIDFEFPNEQGKPYKSSGGEMVYSKELEKEIPKGWKISTLSENTLTTIGGIWGNENPEGKYSKPAICVRGMDIHEIQNGNQKNLKVLFVDPKTSENRKLNSGDIIVEISGGSTNQLTGRVLFISNELLKRFNHEILPASFCKLIRFSDVNYSIFFYYLLKWVRYIGIISQYETGTTSIKNFQYNIFSKEYKFALPTIDLINTFHQQSSKILIKIESNLYQIQILTKIRDSLLPKLMSGKIRVLVEAD